MGGICGLDFGSRKILFEIRVQYNKRGILIEGKEGQERKDIIQLKKMISFN